MTNAMITELVALFSGSLLISTLFQNTGNSQVQSTQFSELIRKNTHSKKNNFMQKVSQASCFLGKDAVLN